MTDMTKNIRAKGRMDANSRWRVSQLLVADCKKNEAPPMMGGHTKNAMLMAVGRDSLSHQNKTSGRNDEKMYTVTNRRYFRGHECPCKCS